MAVDSSDYTGSDGQKPWLCIRNEVTDSVITASSARANHAAEAVRGPQTYSGWSPLTLPAWVAAEFASPSDATINYVGMYIPDGGDCTYQAEYHNGVTWVAIGSPVFVASGERKAVLYILDTVPANAVRATVDGDTDSGFAYVATLKAGMADIFPYCPPVGFAPSFLNPDETYTNTFSEGGQILGSQMIRSQASESFSFDIMTPAWVRSVWTTIRPLIRTEGVFMAWRPESYPEELIYGMVTGSPAVRYASITRMSVAFTIEGPTA